MYFYFWGEIKMIKIIELSGNSKNQIQFLSNNITIYKNDKVLEIFGAGQLLIKCDYYKKSILFFPVCRTNYGKRYLFSFLNLFDLFDINNQKWFKFIENIRIKLNCYFIKSPENFKFKKI